MQYAWRLPPCPCPMWAMPGTNIVIPNIKFREEDEELFEDNPIEYIRCDIEGSDSDTRRRTACELVKGLRKFYETEVRPRCTGAE